MKKNLMQEGTVDVTVVGKEQDVVQLSIPEFDASSSEEQLFVELESASASIVKKVKSLDQLDQIVETIVSRTQEFADARGVQFDGATEEVIIRPLSTIGFPTSHQEIVPKIAAVLQASSVIGRDAEKKSIIALRAASFNVKRLSVIIRIALGVYDILSARYVASLTETTEVKRALRKEYTSEFAARIVSVMAAALRLSNDEIMKRMDEFQLVQDKPAKVPKAPKAPKAPRVPRKSRKVKQTSAKASAEASEQSSVEPAGEQVVYYDGTPEGEVPGIEAPVGDSAKAPEQASAEASAADMFE